MWIVAIAWMYVAVMMSLTEATAPNGSILGAIVTFLFYGALPVALVMYLLGTPARRKARRAAEAAAQQTDVQDAESQAASAAGAGAGAGEIGSAETGSAQPNAGRLTAGHPIAAERKEP
ncbi:hypothetical protein [Aquabacterium sp.]|uniref:hypothetical protein n=1 Tax=Aquabacterium sp. TaxID=1872578 RepID=UPI002E36524F|nr:hypothetical protein [Aquabacterium sp.]